MKRSAQAGIVHVALIVGLLILGIAGLYIAKNPPKFFDGAEAASNKGVFSSIYADLRQDSASFYFGYSRPAPSGYTVDVATSPDMKQNFYKAFGSGTTSPIIVTDPQSKYQSYKCNTIIYFTVNIYKSGIRSSVSSTNINCSSGIGTTNPTFSPTPTPTPISGSLSTPPPSLISKTIQASDGTWCYDFDGADYVDPGIPYTDPLKKPNINVGYSTQGFCQDNTGVHGDFCESGTNTSRDYYCQSTWDGTKFIHVACAPGGYVCSPGSYIGDYCTRGACAPGNPPAPVSTSTVPATYTMQGSDSTWCNDSDGNGNVATKGTCQDNGGLYNDYCNGSDNIQDYYCTGAWNGSSYTNVRCETGTHGCTSQFGLYCSDGACISSSATPIPATLPSPTPTPTPTPLPFSTSTKKVFVTSSTYSGNLGGLSGADSKCQAKADAANLGGTWKAWLSDSTTSAVSRLTHFNGPYVRKDGLVVANNWTDLTDGTLQNPIRIDELGRDMYIYTNAAWTSTSTSGDIITPNCANWSDGSTGFQGILGGISSTISYWTVGASSTSICSNTIALYCLEQ